MTPCHLPRVYTAGAGPVVVYGWACVLWPGKALLCSVETTED